MPLFRQKVKEVFQSSGAAIPDFTNIDKMREYASSLSGQPQELKAFRATLHILHKTTHHRWLRIMDDIGYMEWYENKKLNANFDLDYCIVKWDKNYTRHVAFHQSIHRRYDFIKSQHDSCDPGSGFYEYNEPGKYLVRWINNITDPKLLMDIQLCCLVGLGLA